MSKKNHFKLGAREQETKAKAGRNKLPALQILTKQIKQSESAWLVSQSLPLF